MKKFLEVCYEKENIDFGFMCSDDYAGAYGLWR